ncbi:hypothetical protein [Acidisphaera sp. L21]|uniref:hypothetical protein n=1 Tax=Acidisphaera sp. L21 TaxID=1641851 RepID=UPI001C20589D|nr:hypothetical protein [Acidisphaera sp. L21]
MLPAENLACYRVIMSEPPDQSRLLPVLLLAGLLALGLLAWWLFPLFQSWVAHQDCVALGRTNCG